MGGCRLGVEGEAGRGRVGQNNWGQNDSGSLVGMILPLIILPVGGCDSGVEGETGRGGGLGRIIRGRMIGRRLAGNDSALNHSA